MFKFGTTSRKRMQGVDPLLIECAERALALSKYDMTIPWMGGIRTAEEQNAIFKDGNSKCDGYEKKSYHQSDFYPGTDQKAKTYGNQGIVF